MPCMIAFGHRWLLGTDDMIFIGLFDAVFYFPWVIWYSWMTYSWFFFDERNFCSSSLLQDIALASFCCSVIVHWLLGIGFSYFSTKGTMRQVEARMPCVTLFKIKTAMIALGILWLVLSGYLFHKDNFCSSNSFNMKETLLMTTIFQTVLLVILVTFWWTIFDGEGSVMEIKGKKKAAQANAFLASSSRGTVYKWKLRIISLLLWNFCTSKSKKDVILSIAEILCEIPQERDICFSNFAVGAMLMRVKHEKLQLKEELMLNSLPAIFLSDGLPVDRFPTTDMPAWMNLLLAKRYFRFGLDMFGLSWKIQRRIARGLRKLWNALLCYPVRKEPLVEGDNIWRSNVADIQLKRGVRYKDLIHVSFGRNLYAIPFSLAVDKDTSAVVITIGIAMSTNEVLIDVAAGTSSTMDAECLKNVSCHDGILKAARRIRDRLVNGGILEAACKSHEGYHLVTTGHRLGASVAAVLALLLRPAHPSVRCFAFETVPCLCAKALETTFDCVFTVVFGNDVVPCFSFRSLERMARKIAKCAEECNLPKHKVFFWPLPPESDKCSILHNGEGGTRNLLPIDTESDKTSGGKLEENDSDVEENEVLGEKGKCNNEDSELVEEAEKANSEEDTRLKQSDDTKFYIPGRILHIRNSKNGYSLQIRTAADFHPPMLRPDVVIHNSSEHIERCLEHLGRTYSLLSSRV